MSIVDAGIVTQWVCTDCFILLVNGDIGDEVENPDALLSKFDGFIAAPGLRDHRCPNGSLECDCGQDIYSTRACDGCGSQFHGERYAVTLLQEQKDTVKHADYPHEPGTLYDCPACDMPA